MRDQANKELGSGREKKVGRAVQAGGTACAKPEIEPYLGTTVILSGPEAEGQGVAEAGHPAQGLERWGLLASALLGLRRSLRTPPRGSQGDRTARGCPFMSASGRQDPEPAGSGPLWDFKAGAPQPIPWRKGRASPGGRWISADGPFIPRLLRLAQTSGRRRSSCRAELSGKAGTGGHKTASVLCDLRSVPALLWVLAAPLPAQKAGIQAFLGRGASWERHSGRFQAFGPLRPEQGAGAHLGYLL